MLFKKSWFLCVKRRKLSGTCLRDQVLARTKFTRVQRVLRLQLSLACENCATVLVLLLFWLGVQECYDWLFFALLGLFFTFFTLSWLSWSLFLLFLWCLEWRLFEKRGFGLFLANSSNMLGAFTPKGDVAKGALVRRFWLAFRSISTFIYSSSQGMRFFFFNFYDKVNRVVVFRICRNAWTHCAKFTSLILLWCDARTSLLDRVFIIARQQTRHWPLSSCTCRLILLDLMVIVSIIATHRHKLEAFGMIGVACIFDFRVFPVGRQINCNVLYVILYCV